MHFQELSFEQSLSIKYYGLFIEGFQGIELNNLETLADFECKKLLNHPPQLQNAVGNSMLKYEISKHHNIKENNILIRSNIYDILNSFEETKKSLEIELPSDIYTNEQIINYINKLILKDKYYYFIDNIGLDVSKIKQKNLIIFSSIKELFGIKGLGICWAIFLDEQLRDKFFNLYQKNGPANSVFSEIMSIIAFRNSVYIKKINESILKKNFKYLQKFLTESKIFDSNINLLKNYAQLRFKDERLVSDLLISARKKEGILLEKCTEKSFYIHFGQDNFKQQLEILSNFIQHYKLY